MKIDISQDNFGALCICATRYCRGRQTYMPSLVQGIVREHLSELSNRDIRVMLGDCKLQDDMNLYGDPNIDKPNWLRWREDLEKEYARRRMA